MAAELQAKFSVRPDAACGALSPENCYEMKPLMRKLGLVRRNIIFVVCLLFFWEQKAKGAAHIDIASSADAWHKLSDFLSVPLHVRMFLAQLFLIYQHTNNSVRT